MNKKFGGWAFTLIGGACTLFLVISSLNDNDWSWVTDMSRLPKYALAGPLPLIAGLVALRDAHGQDGGEGGAR